MEDDVRSNDRREMGTPSSRGGKRAKTIDWEKRWPQNPLPIDARLEEILDALFGEDDDEGEEEEGGGGGGEHVEDAKNIKEGGGGGGKDGASKAKSDPSQGKRDGKGGKGEREFPLRVVVVEAETGSGKTTRIAQAAVSLYRDLHVHPLPCPLYSSFHLIIKSWE